MFQNINLSQEDKFIIKLLFTDKRINPVDFKKINYERLVKIASSHLVIPSIYSNLKRKKYLKFIPKDFSKYIEEIYKINHSRNKELLNEIIEISKFLKNNNIKYIFLKGSSLLLGGYFDDIGDRMIGDIDLLVEKDKKKEVIKILSKNNYNSRYIYQIWDANVNPNFINRKRLFAIDLHNRLFPKKYDYVMNSIEVFKNSILTKDGIRVMNYQNEYEYAIYNYQISDHGSLKALYSYRKIYDIIKISNKNSIKIDDIKNNRLGSIFYGTTNILGITKISTPKPIISGFYKNRIIMKYRYNLYFEIDQKICETIIFLEYLHIKLLEFLVNKDYRSWTYKKLSKTFKKFYLLMI